METGGVAPIQQGQRTAIVDILRGWALLGVVIMNYVFFSQYGNPANLPKIDTVNSMLEAFLNLFFSSKSWTLLSVLFGYGFAALIDHIREKGRNPVRFFSGRMFWLFVIAFINACFFFGDILKDYALMGLIFLFFYKSKGRFAFILSLVLIAMLPFVGPLVKRIPYNVPAIYSEIARLYESKNILTVFKANLVGTYKTQIIAPGNLITTHIVKLACLLLGFAAYKFGVFNNLAKHINTIQRVFWYSLFLACSLWIFSVVTTSNKWSYPKYFSLNHIQVLSTMVVFTAGICWLYAKGKCKTVFTGMQAMGKMTLTNYMVQNMLSLFIFSGVGFGISNSMPKTFYVSLAILVYIVQVLISLLWLKHYRYGPVEWVWRQLSYGERLPIRRPKA